MKKSYGRLLGVEKDKDGRQIHLFLNIFRHIVNYHDKFEVWSKHWVDVIQNVLPKKVGEAWYYNKPIDDLMFQIRVVHEDGIYLIKTAIISKGSIGKFERNNYV